MKDERRRDEEKGDEARDRGSKTLRANIYAGVIQPKRKGHKKENEGFRK
jgi:hypothetical protein